MESTISKNTATLLHLSALSQYVLPFGNYILPIVIWSTQKEKSAYVDAQGKQAINFQLSLFLYTLVLAMIAIPILFFTVFSNVSMTAMANDENWFLEELSISNLTGLATLAIIAVFLFFCLKIAEFFLIIYASVKSSNGEDFKYPLTIPFIK